MYRGFSPKPPGGGFLFMLASKWTKKKIQHREIGFHRLWVILAAETKSKVWNLRKPPGVGFLFLLAPLKKPGKNPTPMGVCRALAGDRREKWGFLIWFVPSRTTGTLAIARFARNKVWEPVTEFVRISKINGPASHKIYNVCIQIFQISNEYGIFQNCAR